MYTIYDNDTILYYPGDKEYCISEGILNQIVGESGEFNTRVTPNNPIFNTLKERQIITIHKDDEEYWRGDIREINTDFRGMKALYCLEDLAFLGEVIKYAHSVEKTYSQYFVDLLNEYNSKVNESKRFEIGYILKNPQERRVFTFETMSILEILRAIADDYYVRVRRANGKRYIDIVDLKNYNNGHVSNQPIQFGDNMMDFVKESNSSWLLSAILPVGAELDTQTIPDVQDRVTIESVNQGSKVLVNQTAVNNYGYIEKLVEFDSATTPAELKELATQYLQENSQPRLTMEIQAIDLSTISDYEAYSIGDKIPIICEPFGIDQTVSLCELEIDLLDPSRNDLTLSSAVERRSFTDIQNQISADIKKIPEKSEMLTAARKVISSVINAAGDDGHVVLHENSKGVIYEILIMNKPDILTATKMWRWNENGFGFREKKDGEWEDYKVAIDMEGQIVADLITTGTLTAIDIDGVTIKGSTIIGSTFELDGTNATLKIDNDGWIHGTSSKDAGSAMVLGGKNGSESLYGSYYMHSFASGTPYYETETMNVVKAGAEHASDKRLKKNIKLLDFSKSKNIINSINSYSFAYKKMPNKTHFGIIAQELLKALLNEGYTNEEIETVYKMGKDGMYGISYVELIPHLMNYVKDLQNQINELKKGEKDG